MSENPFDEPSSNPTPPPKPNTMRTGTTTSTVNTTNSSSTADPARAERLRQLEAELNRRENDLDARTQILIEREKTGKNPREPNWPKCYPIVYQDIDGDIKDPSLNRFVKMGYSGILAFFVMLFYNIVCTLAVLIVENDGTSIGDFVLAIVFFFLLGPVFLFVYRLMYKAGRKVTKPSAYISFLCSYFFQILVHIFFFVGAAGTGAAGFFSNDPRI